MGLFDYVRCELPLPEGQDEAYQTKDLDHPAMRRFIITAAGRLVAETWDTGPERLIDGRFDGDVHFYGDALSYRATFRLGDCQEICREVEGDWVQVWAVQGGEMNVAVLRDCLLRW